jgi:hypothetical protein
MNGSFTGERVIITKENEKGRTKLSSLFFRS